MVRISFEGAAVTVMTGNQRRDILHPITCTLHEQRIGIIGANGSGKSTLARLINGLSEPTSGQVTVAGLDPVRQGKQVRHKVGFIFSDAENQIVMPLVRDDVAFSLRRFKFPKHKVASLVDAALNRFHLSAHAQTSPHVLSGGQKQLLGLASVLVTEPELIIADEPTTLLDLRHRIQIRREFAALTQQLIVVTHDLELIEDFDRVLCLDHGTIVDDGPPHKVIPAYIARMRETQ